MAVCGTLRLPYLWFSSGANTSAGQILQLSSKTHTFGHFEIYPVVSKSINNKTHGQWHFGSMTWFEPKCKRCLMIKFEPPLFPRYFIKISISTCRSNQRPSPSSSSSSFKDNTYYHPNPHCGPLISIKAQKPRKQYSNTYFRLLFPNNRYFN